MARAAQVLAAVRRLPRAVRMPLYCATFFGVMLVLLPWLFDHTLTARFPWRPDAPWLRVAGWVLFGVALLLYLATTFRLVRHGRGANVEFDPPMHLVTSGPYARCRNPLVVCVLAMLLGLAGGLASPGVFALFLVAVPAAWAQVRLVEEPELTRRFGDAYARYVARVPRWNPFGTRRSHE